MVHLKINVLKMIFRLTLFLTMSATGHADFSVYPISDTFETTPKAAIAKRAISLRNRAKVCRQHQR